LLFKINDIHRITYVKKNFSYIWKYISFPQVSSEVDGRKTVEQGDREEDFLTGFKNIATARSKV